MIQQSRIETLIGSAALILAMLLVLLATESFEFLQPVYVHPDNQLSEGWVPVLHLSTNAFWLWRFDAALFPFVNSLQQLAWLSLGILMAGMVVLTGQIRAGSNLPLQISTATALSLLIVVLFALDPVIIAALSWVPWCIILLTHANRLTGGLSSSACLATLPFALFLGLRLTASANQFALYLICLTAYLALRCRDLEQDNPSETASMCFIFCLACLLAPALLVFVNAPTPALPEYPDSVLLFSRKLYSRSIQSWIFNSSNMVLFDRTLLRESSGLFILLTIASCLCIGKARTTRSHRLTGPSVLAFILSLICVLDVVLPEETSRSLPMAAIERALPQFSFVALIPLVIAALLLLITVVAVLLRLAWLPAALLFLLLIPANAAQLPNSSSFGRLLHPSKFEPPVALSSKARKLIFSPSYPVFRRFGVGLLHQPDLIASADFRRGLKRIRSITASDSAPPRRLRRMFDSNQKTHWRPTSGLQTGSEWLLFKFAEETSLTGIQLHTRHHTEFPAALEVLGSRSCAGNSPDTIKELQVLTQHQPWDGTIEFTSEGHPYYGSRARGQIIFDQPENIRCLLIRQTGRRSKDWTIAELRFSFTK